MVYELPAAEQVRADADALREQIVTDRRHELYVRAEPRQIVADVARHAAGRDLDLAGVGIARLDRRVGPAAEIDVRAADADGIDVIHAFPSSCDRFCKKQKSSFEKYILTPKMRKVKGRKCELSVTFAYLTNPYTWYKLYKYENFQGRI